MLNPSLVSFAARVLACAAGGLLLASSARAANRGDCVALLSFSSLGVPLHPRPGNAGVSGRVPGETVAVVRAVDEATQWLDVSTPTASGWITPKYAGAPVPCPSSAAATDPLVTPLFYQVGSWNLEHFHDAADRGFPENTSGGPSYPTRTAADYDTIAAIIEGLEAKVLVLEEVNGETPAGGGSARSPELERLVAVLGSEHYSYVIARSGGAQRVAILYDRRGARLNAVCEGDFPAQSVDGKQVFDRQPLFAHFTLLAGGKEYNDLLIVGVHLASGQANVRNHDAAIATVVEHVKNARGDEACVPGDEQDVLITGDFNASRFDGYKEKFWTTLETHGWDVLADPGYPGTRLAGVPLRASSVIDYVVVSKGALGLGGEEVTAADANVHSELVSAGAEEFRLHASDHLPVTVPVRVGRDTDASVP